MVSLSQTLKMVGAGGHYPTNRLQSDEKDSNLAATYFSSFLENLKGRGEALAELGIFALYKVRTQLYVSHSMWRGVQQCNKRLRYS